MFRFSLNLVVLLLLAVNVNGQESTADVEPGPEQSDPLEETAATAAAGKVGEDEEEDDEEVDDADLDDHSYEDDDDGFIPTEEIQAGQAIPFPTDI